MSLEIDHDLRPVVLIGFMATGKSTVGRLLADAMGWTFVDLDTCIEKEAGMSVAEIFRTAGEPRFRQYEARALQQMLAVPRTVIATGGGAACREDNLRAMLAQARVVALSALPAEILKRVGQGSGRPLLDGASEPLKAAAELLAQREPFYAQAHIRIDTVGKTAKDVADLVLSAVRREEEA